MQEVAVGFIGAGGIARAHVYALQSLRYFYDQAPAVILESVCSASEASREHFSRRFGFAKSEAPEQFFANNRLDAVWILGPNQVHFDHLKRALEMPRVRRIYIEKPVCASVEEERAMRELAESLRPEVKVQVGFQFLQTAAVREMLNFWKSGILGRPIHFDLKYYHGDYLRKAYRDRRQTRLAPAPEGGAMADLGSHGISLLLAFMGPKLQVLHALQGGRFPDVPVASDLFSSISLVETKSGAVGHLSASRISSGSGDLVDMEIYAENGMIRYSTRRPDQFEYYREDAEAWTTFPVGSAYAPLTSFPSGHVSPGWLRSLMHAHYLFLGAEDPKAFLPDLRHGLEVQRLVRETAEHLEIFARTNEKCPR